MAVDTQLLLKEIQKISTEQVAIQKQLTEQKDFLERRFTEVDVSIDKRFKDADDSIDLRFKEAEIVLEQRIIDSELRQDARLQIIEKTAIDLVGWHQDQEGLVDDMRLRLSKLDKYWARAAMETAVGIY